MLLFPRLLRLILMSLRHYRPHPREFCAHLCLQGDFLTALEVVVTCFWGQDPSIITSFPGSECSVGLAVQTGGARCLAFHRVPELGHSHLLRARELGSRGRWATGQHGPVPTSWVGSRELCLRHLCGEGQAEVTSTWTASSSCLELPRVPCLWLISQSLSS